MSYLVPKNAKSVKNRFESMNESTHRRQQQSHFLVSPDKLDKVTRRVIAPYAQIERKGLKEDESKEPRYLDMSRFTAFLGDTVDLDSLLYETAVVLKTITNSSGVFVYIVNKAKNEIVMMPHNTKNPDRHEVNIPIGEGKVTAAHVAFTKEYLVLDDVPRDSRFSEGLKWVDAKTALCMPVVKPDGECYAVLELFRTHYTLYDSNVVYVVVSVCCWAGAAVHQARARITLQRTAHLNSELLALLQNYFCDLASFDTMVTDMLAVVKTFLRAQRSSFYIVDKERGGGELMADMWDDGWASENTAMPKRRVKVNLNQENSPAAHAARTGLQLNILDAYKDKRFSKEIDPTTGTVVRATLVSPVKDKHGVIGVVQLTNKLDGGVFDTDDQEIFNVFVKYCSLIVHFAAMQQKKIFHNNLNEVYSSMLTLHLSPCQHDMAELVGSGRVVEPPPDFQSFDFYISEATRADMPGLVTYIFLELFPPHLFDRPLVAEFVLTILQTYRQTPYHNAEHAFCFTHTMYLVLRESDGHFDNVETIALLIAGLSHDLDHPGVNNNFLALTKHPLSQMYRTSTLEYHHYFMAKKIIMDKNILSRLPDADRERVMDEIKYNILCTDLAVYFQLRAQLAPVVADQGFDWMDQRHRRMLKGIVMTTCDLSGCCKPFVTSKLVAEKVYEEFYTQGDMERALGYTPLSMMDRRRSGNQPAEQIQFLSVVVAPCLLLLHSVLSSVDPMLENVRKTQDGWHEEIEIRGQKLWRQEDSIPGRTRSSEM